MIRYFAITKRRSIFNSPLQVIMMTFNKNQRTHIILLPDIFDLSFVINNMPLHFCVWLSTADQQ